MSDSMVTVTINGKDYSAESGTMLIEVADKEGIHIPRFCYHKELTISANCRMCLVEVEKAPKPMPACATPVNNGMKVFTHSTLASTAQKDTMEFLLINHPLDCPICDQGGECELQDLSVAHGGSASNYKELKRVVVDKDIGPLISTEMTRCIQCMRCVRFGEEIAGMREMGGTGRGERLSVGTYIDKHLESELSGNIIDLCPVGALTAKPSRYTARSWEIAQAPSIASHDSIGSNIFLHTFRNKVIRTVPLECDEINQCWLSDRDRFSYQGLYADDRLEQPRTKVDGEWVDSDWDEVLNEVTSILNTVDANDIGVLASDRATTEELFLLQKLMRAKGISNIDHRLRQTDFSHQENAPQFPWLGLSLNELDQQDVIVLIGSDVRHEQPMANHRIRRAVLNGAKVVVINPLKTELNYPVNHEIVANPQDLLKSLAAILAKTGSLPSELANIEQSSSDVTDAIADVLAEGDKVTLLLGNLAVQQPSYGTIRALVASIANNTEAKLGYLAESANTVGAWLAGVVPHRVAGGDKAAREGLNSFDMMNKGLKTLVLYDVDPAYDCADPQLALAAASDAKVIAFTAFASEKLLEIADIVLPISCYAEMSGTFISGEGRPQSFRGVSAAPKDAKPGWRILRVLGNKLELDGFDYMSSGDVLAEFNDTVTINKDNTYSIENSEFAVAEKITQMQRVSRVHAYSADALVRRANALQKTYTKQRNSIALNPQDIKQHGFSGLESITIKQGDARTIMTLVLDEDVPIGCVQMLVGTSKSAMLGAAFGAVELQGEH
ncbi:MAG: NADH-quinone oxidoreductase subunit G [Thiotrichaceae bacterium]|nr:NADH-quinone oxidoreductase subunit G [Thiotrichaceae bacterium]